LSATLYDVALSDSCDLEHNLGLAIPMFQNKTDLLVGAILVGLFLYQRLLLPLRFRAKNIAE
jgi:hypothetical protein